MNPSSKEKMLDSYKINQEDYILDRLFVDLVVTARCNHKCWYCINETVDGRSDNLKNADVGLVSDEVFKATLKFAEAQERKITRFKFFGGEPTLHPKLKEMIRYAVENYKGIITTQMTTNHSKPMEYWLDWEHAEVVCSFHSEWVDDVDEWFNKAMYLSSKGLLEHVIIMIQKNNFELVKSLYDKYKDKLKLRFGEIYQIKDSPEFMEFMEENPEITDRLNGVKGLLAEEVNEPDVDIEVMLKDGTNDSKNYKNYNKFTGMMCCSGYVVYPDGGVIYCWNNPKPFMNVLDGSKKLNPWHLCGSQSCGCGLIFKKCSISHYVTKVKSKYDT